MHTAINAPRRTPRPSGWRSPRTRSTPAQTSATPRDLARCRARDPDGEHEHRCKPAGDGIHDAERRALVREREQREVRELERGRAERPRPHLPFHVPRHRGDGREQHDREAEHDGGRGLHVARAREQQVPARVQERCGERQHERGGAHSRTIVTGPSFTSSTAMRAPKTQRATSTPIASSSAQKVRRAVPRRPASRPRRKTVGFPWANLGAPVGVQAQASELEAHPPEPALSPRRPRDAKRLRQMNPES